MVQSVRIYHPSEHSSYSTRFDQPALLKGLAANWPARQRWSPEYFRERFGDCEITLSHYQSRPEQRPKQKFKASLQQYIDVLEGRTPPGEKIGTDSYVAGWHFKKNALELMNDIVVPPNFQDNLLDRVDREIINYDSMSLFIGHSRAETPLHTDSFAVCVWLANLVGLKTIRILPPVDYTNIKNGMDAFCEANVKRWTELGIPVFEASIEAGDIFVIPPGYWHQVRNQGFTVAVSTNYVSPYHFLTFEQQLRAKILAPYVRLLKLKRELYPTGQLDHSVESLKHFDYCSNEGQLLDYLSQQVEHEKNLLQSARTLTGA